MDNCIHYAAGYKYQLRQTYVVKIEILPKISIFTSFVDLERDGTLTIHVGYAWDGPSGPSIDTPNFMRASLVHDALYQLIRERHLHEEERYIADTIMHRMCLEDGMSEFRAWYSHQGVSAFGKPFANPRNHKPEHCAPGGNCCD